MPILATLFGSLFASLASFFAAFVTKKIAFGLAAISVFSILTVALMATIATAINAALSMSSLPPAVVTGFVIFMPANLPACVASILAAEVAAALYRWNVANLKLMAFAS